MRHPTEGTIRRLVDDPAGVPDADREHVAACPACLSGLAAAQEDAALTGAALGVEPTPDVDAGWRRLAQAVEVEGRRESAVAPAPVHAPRWRGALRSPVLATLGVVALLTGAGAAAAADWLQIFRTEQVAPLTVTEADLAKLPDLSAYGDVEVIEEPNVREVPDAGAAEEATGLSVPRVSELPQGVTGDPVFHAGGQVRTTFTFSTEKAAQAAAEAGETLPPPPPGLDGSRFRLAAGPGVATLWPSAQGAPALIVGRAVAPTAYASGIPFETARDYLLSLPGLPDDVASQLRSFSGDGTLPLLVPAGEVSSSPAEIGGEPATLFTSQDGTMAGVVWVDDGVITAVAGSLTADEVLAVARGLRWDR